MRIWHASELLGHWLSSLLPLEMGISPLLLTHVER